MYLSGLADAGRIRADYDGLHPMISDIHDAVGKTPDLRLLRVGPHGTERPAALDSSDRAYDLRPLTQEIDGAFLVSGGISEFENGWPLGRCLNSRSKVSGWDRQWRGPARSSASA